MTDPMTTHTIAHEADQREIDDTFRSMPWAERIRLVDDTIITRKEWKIDVANRAAAAAEAKEKVTS